jgi:hypothetical protein
MALLFIKEKTMPDPLYFSWVLQIYSKKKSKKDTGKNYQ